jgi:hypothetical protein
MYIILNLIGSTSSFVSSKQFHFDGFKLIVLAYLLVCIMIIY